MGILFVLCGRCGPYTHITTKNYVHNFSYFDAIFMMDVLSKLGTVKPLIRDNRFIQLDFSFFTINEKQDN